MKKHIYHIVIMLLLFTSCTVDRLAILTRKYDSRSLISESNEELEQCFSTVQKQYLHQTNKELLALYIEGLIWKKKGRNALALSIFEKIVSQNDTFLDAWLNMADLYEQLGQEQKAQEIYLICIDIIDVEIDYILQKKWPDNHILKDNHVNYAIRYAMIDNSYFSKNEYLNIEFSYDVAEDNLLKLKKAIQAKLGNK